MTSTAKLLCDFSDVDRTSASQGASKSAILGFDEKSGSLDCSYPATFVDEVFGVFVFGTGLGEIAEKNVLGCETSVKMELEGVEHGRHQLESLM